MSLDAIAKMVAQDWEIELEELKLKKRFSRCAWPRHIAMWVQHKRGYSMTEIGEYWDRDHAVAWHAVNAIEREITREPSFGRYAYDLLKQVLEAIKDESSNKITNKTALQAA